MKLLNLSFLLIFIVLSACSEQVDNSADLVLHNGSIISLDDQLNEFEAIAISSDTISFLGSNDEVKNYISSKTKVVDLEGKTAIPGFIESHAHLIGLGKSKVNLDLMDILNWNELVAEVVAKSEELNPGEWIIGRGWHQEKWDPKPIDNVEGYPVHDMLSRAVPYHPVLLSHASGHAVFANEKAMEMAGITNETPDPAGGRIVRDSLGNPIGVFEETAEDLIYSKYREFLSTQSEEQLRSQKIREIKMAFSECLKNGITSFHDAGATFKTIDLLNDLDKESELDIRLNIMVGDSLKNLRENLSTYRNIGDSSKFLNVRSIKMFMDGALGSRGAWLLRPYDDLPSHSGLNVTPLNELREVANLAIDNDYQLCIHAIGDRGNREVLNIYEKIFDDNSNMKDLRWRVEHAQHLAPKDIFRFAELGVIPAMQGVHCTSDAPFVIQRLGMKRAESGAYVWRKLIDAGAVICNGTDAPVERVNPIESYYSTVTRQLKDGSKFFPSQVMTRVEALKSYTINGAYASFEEDIKGTLEIGKLADVTVLSQNLLVVPEEEIQSTEIKMTIVGGKILYEN
jgi:predicted amidohydrolase YtcJ